MKNKTLIVALGLSILIGAQEKEVNEAQNQFDSKQYQTALSTIKKVESNYDVSKIDPNTLREMYYIQAQSYLETGASIDAAKTFAKLEQVESGPIYFVKDKESKEKLYFLDKNEAEAAANASNSTVKEITVENKYSNISKITLNGQLQKSSNQGNAAYESKNFDDAGDKFLETYYLSNALNVDGNNFLYFAAISKYQAENYTAAKPLFQEVVDLGYEGPDPKDNYLENSYRLIAFIDGKNEDWDAVIKTAKEGLQKFPKNEDLNSALANAYNKTGNDEAFINQLKQNIAVNPNDAINFYNLGVLYLRKDTEKDYETAKENFQKALSLNPGYNDAYQNLAMIYIKKDKIYKEQLRELGTSTSDADTEKNIQSSRKAMFQEAAPYLEKAHEQNPDEKLYVQMLVMAYDVIGDDANENKYRAILNTM